MNENIVIDCFALVSLFHKEAAEIKADYPISYADAFCVATAQRSKGTIITNDPEFKLVQHFVPVIWLSEK